MKKELDNKITINLGDVTLEGFGLKVDAKLSDETIDKCTDYIEKTYDHKMAVTWYIHRKKDQHVFDFIKKIIHDSQKECIAKCLECKECVITYDDQLTPIDISCNKGATQKQMFESQTCILISPIKKGGIK